MAEYATVFFDLDHTLWDFETNSRETLRELHGFFELEELGISGAEFVEVYEEINVKLWDQYARGKIDKEVLRVLRWRRAFLQFGIRDTELHQAFGKAYVAECPKRGALMPGALELLEKLHGDVPLAIITNGFEESQATKLDCSGIAPFFDAVITSDRAGAKKPSSRIYDYAFKAMDAKAESSLMVGDNQLADIAGALKMGMDAVHLDVHDKHLGEPATVRVKSLETLLPWISPA